MELKISSLWEERGTHCEYHSFVLEKYLKIVCDGVTSMDDHLVSFVELRIVKGKDDE